MCLLPCSSPESARPELPLGLWWHRRIPSNLLSQKTEARQQSPKGFAPLQQCLTCRSQIFLEAQWYLRRVSGVEKVSLPTTQCRKDHQISKRQAAHASANSSSFH